MFHFYQSVLVLFPLLSLLVSGSPVTSPALPTRDFAWQDITFTLTGGPASYIFTFPADGNSHSTNNDLSISNMIVQNTNFAAYWYCDFYAASGSVIHVGLQPSGTPYGSEITVGPPQPISSIACAPMPTDGQCLPLYSTCYWYGSHGAFAGTCCSGYCGGDKCRPTS